MRAGKRLKQKCVKDMRRRGSASKKSFKASETGTPLGGPKHSVVYPSESLFWMWQGGPLCKEISMTSWFSSTSTRY